MKTYKIISEPTTHYQAKITSSQSAYDVIKPLYESATIDVYESFLLLLLNRSNIVTGWVKISQGGITGTVADVRLVMKYAIDNLACAIIISHNHPSGETKPSSQDIELTNKIKQAAALMDIHLLDHIIVTENKYYSFGDEGML
ncbi:MAG: JAB domain-containing protein [Saprospiraceae bacterium]|nr:JAB domain-containing protein [Saprospiraceae bacterium]